MTLTEAIELLSVSDRQEVEQRLQVLSQHEGVCSQAVINLYAESRLSIETWQALFQAMLKATPDPMAIQKVIVECFRGWTLRGPVLTKPWPTTFGRAVTMDEFCSLLKELGQYPSSQAARQAIRKLLLKPQDVVVRRWRSFDLGRYVMWSTFNAETITGGPFDGMPDSADDIRGLLGLDPNERGLPLLLLEYTLPGDVSPRFPTVVEAYAGDEWPYFFRPAIESAPHGVTMPWPEYRHEAPHPEVVHKVIRVCIRSRAINCL